MGDQITDDRTDPDSDGYGLVGMLMHNFVGNFRARDGFVPDGLAKICFLFSHVLHVSPASFPSPPVFGGAGVRSCFKDRK
jgi:hypothetical protein